MIRYIDDRTIRWSDALETNGWFVAAVAFAVAGALIGILDPHWRSVYIFVSSLIAFSVGRRVEREVLRLLCRRFVGMPSAGKPPRGLLHPPPVLTPGEDEIVAPSGPVGKWLRVFSPFLVAGVCAFYTSAPQYSNLVSSTITNLSGIVVCQLIYLIPQRLLGIPMLCLWVSQNPDGVHVTMPWKTYSISPDQSTVVVASRTVRGRWPIILCSSDHVWRMDLPRARASIFIQRWQQSCCELDERSAMG